MIEETNNPNIDVYAIADNLIGTCKSLDEAVSELYPDKDFADLSIHQCSIIDSITMCCESCGWWIDSDLIDDDGNCKDCQEEARENDDENS